MREIRRMAAGGSESIPACSSLNSVIFFKKQYHIPTYPSASSPSVLHCKDIGNGTASVMENSLTLKAGDRIAH